MRSIFRKQLVGAALPCALLTILSLGVFESGREFDLLGRPGMDGTGPFVAVAWGIAGALIGLMCAVGDEARGAREYTFHRGLPRSRVLLAQSLANLLSLAVALLVVVAAQAALGHWRNDPLTHPTPLYGRLWELVLLSTSAVLGHGMGLSCGLMRQPRWMRMFFTLYAGCGVLYLVFAALRGLGESWIANEALWLALTIGGGAALHFLAARMLRQGVDEERTFAGPLRPTVVVVALVIAAPATLLTVSQVQRAALSSSVRGAPLLGWSNGQWVETRDSRPKALLFDAEQRVDIAPGSEEARYYSVERNERVLELGAGWRPLVNRQERLADARGRSFRVGTWIGARNGRVMAQAVGSTHAPSESDSVEPAPADLELPYRRELARGDGKALSQQLILLPPPAESDAWLIADAADRTLWRLDLAPALPTLSQVGAEGSWSGIDVAIGRARAELEGASSQRNSSRVVLLTADGRRRWNGTELAPAELATDEVWQSECEAVQRFTVEVVDADVLEPHVVLRDKRGELEPLEHRQRAPLGASFAAHLVSALRSPLASVQSAFDFQPRRPTERHEWFDPLVAGGRRPWLLALNLGLSLALALYFAAQRKSGLRAWWLVLFALFGPLTAVLARALEPRRAALPQPPRRTLRIGPRPARTPQREPVAS